MGPGSLSVREEEGNFMNKTLPQLDRLQDLMVTAWSRGGSTWYGGNDYMYFGMY